MKKLSIIVPCYNAEKYLDTLMPSLIKQTIGLSVMEIILVDDASTDRTYEKLLEYEEQYPEQILVIRLEENGRQGRARNIALSYASGKYIGFVDSDDYIEQDMYEMLIRKAEEYQADMVGARVVRHEKEGVFLLPNDLPAERLVQVQTPNDRMSLILHGGSGGICTKIFRRDWICSNELFFPEYTFFEDNYWLAMACLYIDRFYICDKVCYHYIDHRDSTVNKVDDAAIRNRMDIQLQKLHGYVQRGFFKEYYPGIEALFCRTYYIDTLVHMYRHCPELIKHYEKEMKKQVVTMFPHCRENPILMEQDRIFMETAFEEMPTESLVMRLKEVYCI